MNKLQERQELLLKTALLNTKGNRRLLKTAKLKNFLKIPYIGYLPNIHLVKIDLPESIDCWILYGDNTYWDDKVPSEPCLLGIFDKEPIITFKTIGDCESYSQGSIVLQP